MIADRPGDLVTDAKEEWDPNSKQWEEAEQPYSMHGNNLEGYTFDQDGRRLISATSSSLEHRLKVDAGLLSKRWGISMHLATNHMLKATTQQGLPNLTSLLKRRFCTHQQQLAYPHIWTKAYTDTLFSETKSLQGNTCAQLFITD
jgi:hypothetical protein